MWSNSDKVRPMARLLPALCAAVVLLIFPSCSSHKEKETDLLTFPLRGEVVGIDTAKGVVTVSHHEIPNYMAAMTMPFRVKNHALLNGVHVGDSVHATLAVSRVESWLETLTVLGPGVAPRTLSADELLMQKVFRTGEPIPDESLVNQDNRPVRFSQYRGQVLVVTFIYTRCPLPDFCIRMSNNFSKLQQSLDADPALKGKWHLLSISFDPKNDRPEVLKRYGLSYGADFASWELATDPDTSGPTVSRIADGFGLMYAPDGGLFSHNLRTAIIAGDGTLTKVISGNDWSPDEVAGEVREMVMR